LKPDGTAFDDLGSTKTADYAWTDLLDAHDEQGIDIDTAAPRWRGEHMDYGLAIQGLLQMSERARRTGPAGRRRLRTEPGHRPGQNMPAERFRGTSEDRAFRSRARS
jgi:hypothetical protein